MGIFSIFVINKVHYISNLNY
ncbi:MULTISPECIES: erythromycin resistance leader peptide [Staphylococcus]|uniref:Uncharacterized protein n=1 Tax=Staphylococcus saprophyticus TaxID=29385 RepID=A0A0F6PB29_STASA|nr:hypothetical protein [Staphylococcus saprophyticus]NJE83620.1 ErmCL family antibiotic resistance leader peptide [Staphylococcus saprophyticus]PTI41785.1 hypothetical protein BU120_12275 [Staphylococcus xylosus]RXS06570.1 ErmCL family antibiotic resistance leader peptide [Staphylococcus saprophyticus]RXS18720.1 ErmCL family antibiotic resistance leader peptide [Staphylococcus saprophyticus]